MLLNLSVQNQSIESFHSYVSLAENSPDYIIRYDNEGRIIYLNKKMQQFFDLTYESIIGKKPYEIWPDGRYKPIEINIDQTLKDGKPRTIELFIPPVNEYHQISITPLLASDNMTIDSIFLFGRDVTEFKHSIAKTIETNKKLTHLAHNDPLTNLPNRLSLIELLNLRTSSGEYHPFALLYLDLDGFKEINDSFGHPFGDQLLFRVAHLLQELFPSDTFISRTGGDEFVILISCQKDKNIIHSTLTYLIDTLSNPLHIEEIDVYITASIGIAMYPNDAINTEELLQKADSAMYNAKNMGKNTYSFYDTQFTEKTLFRTTLTTHLKKALHNNQLELYFQPQVDVITENIIGTEALIRWPSSEEMISPALFIPIAEESGLILQIGEFVLSQGFQLASQWLKKGISFGRIAINVSARQLTHIDFLSTLDRIIQETGCNPSLIELEITESSILGNPEKMIALLNIIKAKGFNISIDDFGTGYSSLSYLKNLPIDKLKIDISFVRNITNEPKNQTIVKTIIALAKGLQMSVIAEGVETADELEFMRQNGVDSIQGYFYFKPMPQNQFTHLLS
ncbi:MAG: EAL domain-containing protein [Campylobacterales bacterium]|nr:EAL domain-containing protein [Campylobacterales bacterium]